MTATTYTNIPGTTPGASFGGRFSRFFWRIIEAKEKHVKQRIAAHFRGLDDEYLERLGYLPADIARVRRG
jgi:hypothetical protein